MKTLLLSAALSAALFAVSAPASAAPAGFATIATPDNGLAEAAYYGRRRPMMRPHAYRRPMYRRPVAARRSYAPSQSGNARNPSAPVNQQQQGQTTGGPRY